jgi:hypothetical protein
MSPVGKTSPDREIILRYIRDGWNFRIKTVKGRRYITRRRGQEERGLGPYNENFWNLISHLVQLNAETGAPQAQDRRIPKTEAYKPSEGKPELVHFEEDFGRLLEKLSMDRGVTMMMSCGHRDGEGFCTYWNWEEKPDFFELMDELHFDVFYMKKTIFVGSHESERWVLKAMHWYCWGCSAYHPRTHLKS